MQNKTSHIVISNARLMISPKEEAREEELRQVRRIKQTMDHMRVSPAEVAKETGLSRQTVYRVLGGTPAKLETMIASDRAVSGIVHARMQAVSMLISSNITKSDINISSIAEAC